MPHIYPDSVLPSFRRKGYQYAQAETISSTEFKSGRQRLRLTAKIAPESYTLNAVMTSHQLAVFEAWLMHTVSYIEPMSIPIATALDCESKVVTLASNAFPKKMIGTSQWEISIIVKAERQSVMSETELAEALS